MFAVVHKDSPAHALKWSKTERGAKISAAGYNRRKVTDAYIVIGAAERAAADHKIVVYNALTGEPVVIYESDRGSCVDPSTERYHCM